MDKHWDTGLRWWLKWSLVVMAATLAADCLHVMWPYPNGGAGLDSFEADIRSEWARLILLSDGRFPKVADAIHNGLHTVLFKWPGLDYMVTRAQDPTPLDGGGEMIRRGVLATNVFWGTAAAGLQLFSARLAVLVLSLPLIALVAVGASADGLMSWYLRRTGGGRESGFIFHRAKRHAGHTLLVLCFVYLVPPATVDPRIPVTTFAVAYATAIRFAVANFKKYI